MSVGQAVHANLCVLTTQSDRDVTSELFTSCHQAAWTQTGPQSTPRHEGNDKCITQKDIDATYYDEKQIAGKVLINQDLSILIDKNARKISGNL